MGMRAERTLVCLAATAATGVTPGGSPGAATGATKRSAPRRGECDSIGPDAFA